MVVAGDDSEDPLGDPGERRTRCPRGLLGGVGVAHAPAPEAGGWGAAQTQPPVPTRLLQAFHCAWRGQGEAALQVRGPPGSPPHPWFGPTFGPSPPGSAVAPTLCPQQSNAEVQLWDPRAPGPLLNSNSHPRAEGSSLRANSGPKCQSPTFHNSPAACTHYTSQSLPPFHWQSPRSARQGTQVRIL